MDRTNRQIPLPPEGWRRTNRWAGQLSLWAQQWAAIVGFGPKTPSPPFFVFFFPPQEAIKFSLLQPDPLPTALSSLPPLVGGWWGALVPGLLSFEILTSHPPSPSPARPTGVNFTAPSAARPSHKLGRTGEGLCPDRGLDRSLLPGELQCRARAGRTP